MKRSHITTGGALVALLLFGGETVFAQYNERPALAGSGSKAVDSLGRSVKNKRVRAVHSTNPDQEGTSAYFIQKDPFLAYQLGRNLNFREFRDRDGTFDAAVSSLAGPMPDGTTAKITANNQTSCVGCHNLPQGNPGGGASFHKDSGFARNSPHYYGAGIMEMLALQIRADMLHQLDTDGNGWVSAAEASAHGPSVLVSATASGPAIDYGNPMLGGGSTGSPAFNNIFKVWYVDANGVLVPGATQVDGIKTFGYDFEMIVWGWGQGRGRAALNPTNRAFLWDPFKAHGGLEAYDPTTNVDTNGDGISDPSLAGAIQFPVTHQSPDKGVVVDPLGFSRDDPDKDGYLTEISEGDLDLAEWFMLNAPRPAFAGPPGIFSKGVEVMDAMGCTQCHVLQWDVRQQDNVFDGDRRAFDFNVRWNSRTECLEGQLVPLYSINNDSEYVPDRRGFSVAALGTDFRHHDMGAAFAEQDFGGNLNTLWRTAPLWGVGSGFPWGHDGQSLSLEAVIRRHGGEAQAAANAWTAASNADRNKVLRMLERMALYDIESLPADIDGDGVVSADFFVAGMDTGMERFNAEWLFGNPVQIQGPFTNTDGVTVTSWAATNIDQAYGQTLQFRVDSDNDGWPDVWDSAPLSTGYKDGVN